MKKYSWTDFKTICTDLNLIISMDERDTCYYLTAVNGPYLYRCDLQKEDPASSDQNDFETNFKNGVNKRLDQIDTDNSLIVRIKAAKKGWTFNATPIEFNTSTLNSLYSKHYDDSNRSGITLKFYDNLDQEVTDPQNENTIVKTEIDFEPSYDYEVIGGTLRIDESVPVSNDCRLWIVAVPDIPEQFGGSKEMTGGINLKFLAPENSFSIDGRVSKTLYYDENLHTNKLRFTFKHDAGLQISVQILIELYRQ